MSQFCNFSLTFVAMKATDKHGWRIFSCRQSLFSAVRPWVFAAFFTAVLALLPQGRACARAARASNALYDQWAVFSNRQLMAKGVEFLSQQQADSALVCYTIITERLGSAIPEKEDADWLIAAMFNMGYIYSTFYDDYPKSFSYLQRALNLSEQTGSTLNLPYIYNSMAGMYLLNAEMHGHNNTLEEVMTLFSKGLNVAVGEKNWEVAFVIFNNMVSAAVKYQRADLIARQVVLMRNTKIPASTPMLTYIRLTGKGAEAYRQGRYEEAARWFGQAVGQVRSKWEYSAHYKAMAVCNQAYSLMRVGKYAEAIALLRPVEKEALATKEREVLAEVRQMLRDCHVGIGDSEGAERYYVAYLKDRDSLLTANRLEDVNRMRFLDEIGKMSQQVRDLNGKRRLQTVVICGVAAVALVVLVFLLVLARKNRGLRYRNRMLYRNNVAALKSDAEQRRIIENYEQRIAALQRADAEKPAAADSEEREKYKGSTLGDDEKQQLAARIKNVMDSKTGEICSENFSLSRLAELVASNSRYVSQVVNEHFGCNFNSLLSEYRIREACRRLNDHAHYGSLTIEGISRSVGFKSRSNFAAVFRRQTGLSPSEYQRMTREDNNKIIS